MQWYLTKVKYRRLIKMKPKTVSEIYLIRCLSYSDADYTIQEILRERIKLPDVDAIQKDRVKDVYKYSETAMTDVEGTFFRVKLEFNMGKRKESETHIVNATNTEMATKRVHDRLKNSLLSYKVKEVKETDILGIWDKDNIVWMDDFVYRMEDLADQGLKSADINQMEFDFAKGAKNKKGKQGDGDITTDELKETAEELVSKAAKDARDILDNANDPVKQAENTAIAMGLTEDAIKDLTDYAQQPPADEVADGLSQAVLGIKPDVFKVNYEGDEPIKEDIATKMARAMGEKVPTFNNDPTTTPAA